MLTPRIMFRNLTKILRTHISENKNTCKVKNSNLFKTNVFDKTVSNLFCTAPVSPKWINVSFLFSDGKKITKKVEVGEPISKSIEKDKDFYGRALCESVCTCSTCHVYLSPEDFEKIGPATCDDEKDILPYALDVTDRSRLACQIIALPWMEGLELRMPERVADAQPDSELFET